MANFDDKRLVSSLTGLPAVCRTAFAAACAQRLLPAYKSFCEKMPAHPCARPPLASDVLAQLWRELGAEAAISMQSQELIDALMPVIPTDDEAYNAGEPYGQDAVIAVVFALREQVTGSGEDAMWAAEHVYTALDNFVINSTSRPEEQIDEQAVLNHFLIQQELGRQSRDIEKLRAGVAANVSVESLVKDLQRTAEQESADVFGS